MLKKKIAAIVVSVVLAATSFSSGTLQGVSAQAAEPDYANAENWSAGTGTVSQTDTGLIVSGKGKNAGNLINKYFSEPIPSADKFHMTVNVSKLLKSNDGNYDSRFGFYFTDTQVENHVFGSAKGIFIFFQPFAQNDKIIAYNVNVGYNTGAGFAVLSSPNNYYFGLPFGGAISLKLLKDDGGAWHIMLNGTDISASMTQELNTILSAGNLNFGLEATMNKSVTDLPEQEYELTFKQINGQGMGLRQIKDETNFVKSQKSNVSADQKLEAKEDGVYLTGTLPAAGHLNFKYGSNQSVKGFNGFTTTFRPTLEGFHETNGMQNGFNFAITTTGDGGVNADRLDTWDYFGAKVNGARGFQVKFMETSAGFYKTLILVMGEDGELNHPGDFFDGNNVTADANGNITISIVEDNDKNHWYLLVNGEKLIPAANNNLQAAFTAELNALNTIGGCPVYSAGYDNLGTTGLTKPSAQIKVLQINGAQIGSEIIPVTLDRGNAVTGSKKLSSSDFILSDLNKDNASYTMTDNGLKISAMNGPSGFNSIISYKEKLSTDSIGVTLKLDKVFESTPGYDHHVDVLFSSKAIANFPDAKCLYVRMNTKGDAPSDGLSVTVVINTQDSAAGITNGIEKFDIPVGADGKVIVKLLKNNQEYLLFINEVKVPLSSINSKIATLFNETLNGQVYLTTSSGFDNVDDAEEPTVYYVEAVNGMKWEKTADSSNPDNSSDPDDDQDKDPVDTGDNKMAAVAVCLLLTAGSCLVYTKKRTVKHNSK